LNTLIIPLPLVSGTEMPIDVTMTGKDLTPEGVAEVGLTMARVVGTLSEMGSEYLFRGRISGVYSRPCDRCLENAEVAFDIDASWVYVRGGALEEDVNIEVLADETYEPDVDGSGMVTIEGDMIDLRPQVWEEIVLAQPAKVLCRSDCAGLCPTCGANRNQVSCSCREMETTSTTGLGGLAKALADLKSKRTEE